MIELEDRLKIGNSSEDKIIIVGEQSGKYICSVQIKQTSGGAIAGAMDETRRVHAIEIVRRWNLYKKMRELCELAVNPEAPYKKDRLAFAKSIIEAIEEKAKEALAEAKDKSW